MSPRPGDDESDGSGRPPGEIIARVLLVVGLLLMLFVIIVLSRALS